MPNIQMFIAGGFADPLKAELISRLTDATCQSLDAPPDSVRIWLSEVAPSNFGCAGVTAAHADGRPDLAFIQAILIAGRSDAQKARLIVSMTDAAVQVLGIPADVVRVAIQDIPNTEFGIGGQTAAALGRGIGRQR
ncbi:tautomerase family protein [Cupriavidus necator]